MPQCCGNFSFSSDFKVCIFPAVIVFTEIKRKKRTEERKEETLHDKNIKPWGWFVSILKSFFTIAGTLCQRLNKGSKAVYTPQSTCTQTRKLAWRGEGQACPAPMAATCQGACSGENRWHNSQTAGLMLSLWDLEGKRLEETFVLPPFSLKSWSHRTQTLKINLPKFDGILFL